MAVGLFLIQVMASLGNHHFFYRATTTGVLLRGGLITAVYDRSLRLTTRARTTLTNGKLVNHISTDISRIDFCAGFFQMALTAPIQMAICLVLLILNLGPSALAGFAFFVLCTPIQTNVMNRLMALRSKSMVWTDKRAKLLQELLGGMKIIKFFAWEDPYLKRIGEYRSNELKYVFYNSPSPTILILSIFQIHPIAFDHPRCKQCRRHLSSGVGLGSLFRRIFCVGPYVECCGYLCFAHALQPSSSSTDASPYVALLCHRLPTSHLFCSQR